jgi:hypothetical protein
MNRLSTRPWILALVLVACRDDSGSGSDPSVFGVRSISVPDFGSWECNRPIEFRFSQPIDFASVSERSIRIRTSIGVPAVGTFALKPIDGNGDGVPDGADERIVVFYPSCPQAEDLSDAGLTPGQRYLVTLAGEDSGADPDALLLSASGEPLARTVVLAFETIADPARSLHDERPGAPRPIVRATSASPGLGCFLELGEDPANRVFFEGGPTAGRTPQGFAAPLNLLGDPATRVAVVIVFDQLIRPTPGNLGRLRLEYNPTPGPSGWRALETRAELLANCRPDVPSVRLVPLGSFPPGGFVRARIEEGFEDSVGQRTGAPTDGFALTGVETVAFASLDPAGAVADGLREEFDFGPGSPLSLADPAEPRDAATAVWGEGELSAHHVVVDNPPELGEFDWIVRTGERVLFDTATSSILGGPGGERTMVQTTDGGFIAVRHLEVQPAGEIRVIGPNPLVIHASGTVSIDGLINASGFDAFDLQPGFPGVGGQGVAGGGNGGLGRLSMNLRGSEGSGAFGARPGGGGGESGFAGGQSSARRRGGGGGGGRFAGDRGELVAESGGDGVGAGAESGLAPARGGAVGPDVFVDGDPSNDFFGIQPIVDASGVVVAKRRGELDHLHAGSGGGNGGDSIATNDFPVPPDPVVVDEGGGGGGGGGAVVIRAAGRITFGSSGRILANGGRGGRTIVGFDLAKGAAGGSGSGGHLILESGEAIDFTAGSPALPSRLSLQAVGGPRLGHFGAVEASGGPGGPGVVQLHVPHPERALDDPASSVILPLDALARPDPLSAIGSPPPYVLYPTVGSRSSARSRWIPLGAAGEGGASGPASVVGFLFDGIETTTGEDEGKVRTQDERVLEPAPILVARLSEPGIELLPDGFSLALSGPVLAPLRASGQPISPDVYLRTPALLEGFELGISGPFLDDMFTIAGARYDDARSVLTLTVGGLPGTLSEAVAALGTPDRVDLALVPRFFRVRQGASGVDVLPDTHSVRILFQGAADDGTGRADEENPLLDWTADVTRFALLPPGALDYVRFQVDFELDPTDADYDPTAEPLALDFLRLPFRF